MTAPTEWEMQRACRSEIPGPWDLDAPRDAQIGARDICNACPVKALCDRDIRERVAGGEHVQGVYAGLVWDTNPTKKRNRKLGKTLEDFHRNRRDLDGGQDAQPWVVVNKLPDPEYRQCAAPGCTHRFAVPTGAAKRKAVCGSTCQKRYAAARKALA